MQKSSITYYLKDLKGSSSYLFDALYYLAALVFIASGLLKIYDATGLMEALQQVVFLNKHLIVLVATTLPLVELGLGIALLLKYKPAVILGLASGLFLTFWIFSLYGFFQGFSGDCGCFGNLVKSRFGWQVIVRNFLLLCATGYLWMQELRLQTKPFFMGTNGN